MCQTNFETFDQLNKAQLFVLKHLKYIKWKKSFILML